MLSDRQKDNHTCRGGLKKFIQISFSLNIAILLNPESMCKYKCILPETLESLLKVHKTISTHTKQVIPENVVNKAWLIHLTVSTQTSHRVLKAAGFITPQLKFTESAAKDD